MSPVSSGSRTVPHPEAPDRRHERCAPPPARAAALALVTLATLATLAAPSTPAHATDGLPDGIIRLTDHPASARTGGCLATSISHDPVSGSTLAV